MNLCVDEVGLTFGAYYARIFFLFWLFLLFLRKYDLFVWALEQSLQILEVIWKTDTKQMELNKCILNWSFPNFINN